MKTRLGLDIGTNSIGWWLYETDAAGRTIVRSIDGGVRLFSDGRQPKSGASKAVDRREARSHRRRRDRYLRRRAKLMLLLAEAGLMPADPEQAAALADLDPYLLRAAGLDERLPLPHLGRALFHLNQRRGFKSNRKTDRGDNESSLIKDAAKNLDWEIREAGARTYGEYLHKRRAEADDPRRVPTVRTRMVQRLDENGKPQNAYDTYPDRRHLEAEFHALWDAQASYVPDTLTDVLKDAVYETIFHQRQLKKPEIGSCMLTGEERLPKAHPLTQRRTLYETVNALRITADGQGARPLTLDQRNQIVYALDNRKRTKSLSGMTIKLPALAKQLKLRREERFTLEAGARDAIACDPVRALLSAPDRFGSKWSKLSDAEQAEVTAKITEVQSDEEHEALCRWLQDTHNLPEGRAEETANTRLPEGYGRLGITATVNILEKLQEAVIPYSDAVALCGWHHSDLRTGECLDELPYYGEVLDRHVIPGSGDAQDDPITRYGRLTNPTVHIGLNQVRRLVNKIIAAHGKPDQIVVEVARDLKQSVEEKKKRIKTNKENAEAAKGRSRQLDELGLPDTGGNRMLLRLWEDLGPATGPRLCPYTGQTIGVKMVFDGSCDVDHILPYSRTLDDSPSNKTLCLRDANREKGNATPWEAWGGTSKWPTIEVGLKRLPENKAWRFGPDAMTKYEGERSFLDRALVDTQYLARLARTYLDTLYTEGGHVWVVPGRMTAMLRRHWGLNGLLTDKERGAGKEKNRTDHRHHAIDAAVVAATDRGLLQRISSAAGKGESAGQSADLIAGKTPPPWEGFRATIAEQLARIVVSHRADHGRIGLDAKRLGRDSTAGQLHNDTAYGIVDAERVVTRRPFLSLEEKDLQEKKGGPNIRDPQLREALLAATKGAGDKKSFEAALRNFARTNPDYRGIRRVRMIETLQQSARVEIGTGPDGAPFKAYKGDSNHCYELWRRPDGKIVPQVVTTFEAHQGVEKRPHPAAKRLLRLFKKDMVALIDPKSEEGATIICTVQKLDASNGLYLTPHLEGNADARNRDRDDPFKLLQMGAGTAVRQAVRRVHVDEMGRLRDPGPPAWAGG